MCNEKVCEKKTFDMTKIEEKKLKTTVQGRKGGSLVSRLLMGVENVSMFFLFVLCEFKNGEKRVPLLFLPLV
jgi:hypothetical protein